MNLEVGGGLNKVNLGLCDAAPALRKDVLSAEAFLKNRQVEPAVVAKEWHLFLKGVCVLRLWWWCES